MSDQEQAIALIRSLPSNCTYDDILVEIELAASFREARKDVAAGRIYTTEEAKQRVLQWPKSSGPTNR
jgi:hypothetical protein